jgi:two-component system, NarL family, nitrate/nitrite response regulator NarL
VDTPAFLGSNGIERRGSGRRFVGSATVMVVAEVRLYREGLVNSIAAHGGLTVVGTAGDRATAICLAASTQPEVVVLDMATQGSLDLVCELRGAIAGAKILAFAVQETESDILACARAGVAGYVTAGGSIDDLVDTITRCIRGELLCSPQIAAMLFRGMASRETSDRQLPSETTALSRREVQIVELIEAGLSNKEIAQRLNIEITTVKNHVHNVLQKLNVGSRAAAAAWLRKRTVTRVARGAPLAEVPRP